MTNERIIELINKMPKAEIHLHLEGAFTLEFLYGLIQKYDGDPEINSIDDLSKKFVFKDFAHFIDTWFWKNKFFCKPEDFEESTYQTIKELSYQNVQYAEVFFSPWDFTASGLKVETISEATISGIKRAERDFPIKIGLIADIVRDHGAETSLTRLNQITPFLGKGILGIGLGGNESSFPPILFKEVFIEAKKRGFRTTAHAGEASGPESVWSALKDLKAERIGHGVRAIEDPKLVEYLAKEQIPLEICPTSNLKTQVYHSLNEHPFNTFFKHNLLITVNSDDPSMFNTNITKELVLLHEKLNYSFNNLSQLMENAVEASFLDPDLKKMFITTIKQYTDDNDH